MYVAGRMEPLNVQFVNETDDIVAATNGWQAGRDSADSDDGVSTACRRGTGSSAIHQQPGKARPPPGKKTMGRVKINMEYIRNKVRRYTTFSKRKTGIMKKVRSRTHSCCLLPIRLLVISIKLEGDQLTYRTYSICSASYLGS